MTQSTILAETKGSDAAGKLELHAAIKKQIEQERVSFHTPGHKGRLSLDISGAQFAADLTELPGLDELANAHDVLQNLQTKIASIWQTEASLISVNGASAALTAAILSCANRGGEILLPRNVHRSAINALIISGLDPIWYEPEWLTDWGTWGGTPIKDLERLLIERAESLAALVVCSPNYAGIFSAIENIASLCREYGVVLIVDEAHGAHLAAANAVSNRFSPSSSDRCLTGALALGADLVVHSLHKTLNAPTQTGLLHINKDSRIAANLAQSALNTLQSSSPSYLLMLGIEKSLLDLESDAFKNILTLSDYLIGRILENADWELLDDHINSLDPMHFLLRHKALCGNELYNALAERGVYAETVLGNGVLLLIGLGSKRSDVEILLETLADISLEKSAREEHGSKSEPISKPIFSTQNLNPRKAFFANSTQVHVAQSLGKIACDWVAPCPPGYPVLCPGQQITREIIESLDTNSSIRVINNQQLQGDSDGSNNAT